MYFVGKDGGGVPVKNMSFSSLSTSPNFEPNFFSTSGLYTNQLAVNLEISAFFYIISLNYVLLFPWELTNISPTTFARIHTNGLGTFWDQYSSGTISSNNPIFCCYVSYISKTTADFDMYGVKPTEQCKQC